MSEPCNHEWKQEYYGSRCTICGLFYSDENAPWNYVDENLIAHEEEAFSHGDDWDDDDEWFDCGWVRGVGCTLAGTEECDFDCPHRRDFEKGMALTRARLAKRAKEKP